LAQIPSDYQRALERWGYLADQEAKKYGLPNGATLIAKIAYVESGMTQNLGITSSAGAQGPTQFMPSTRESFIKQYGVDPWGSVEAAIHATGIFMKTLGLAQYNPGSSTYISEVLHAPVSVGAEGNAGAAISSRSTGAAKPADPRAPKAGAAASGSSGPMSFLITAVLVLGGIGLVALGAMRAVGAGAPA
jgi:membrane-bound lytic murein transglycosylase B